MPLGGFTLKNDESQNAVVVRASCSKNKLACAYANHKEAPTFVNDRYFLATTPCNGDQSHDYEKF